MENTGVGLWPSARVFVNRLYPAYRGISALPMPQPRRPRQTLATDHPTAVAFLDESGSISQDRFFTVGCLKLSEPSVLLRQLQKLRDRHHWYHEIHFVDLTKNALPFYERVVEIVAASGGEFSCFVADRNSADPVARFGSPWKAYEKLATQLLLGSIKRREIVTVLADNYSTPDSVVFEQDVRVEVNKRLRRVSVDWTVGRLTRFRSLIS